MIDEKEIKTLQDENISLRSQVIELHQELVKKDALITHYEERLRLSTHRLFGASSEKTLPGQKDLGLEFDEAENAAEPGVAEETVDVPPHKRRKPKGKREMDLSGLPTETVNHELTEEQRVCPVCGERMDIIGNPVVRREVKVIPAKVVALEHHQEVCACRNCEKNSETAVPVVKASVPAALIPNSPASAELMSHVLSQKFDYRVSLYHQVEAFAAMGLNISRQVLANLVILCALRWFAPLYDLMRETLLSYPVLHADETELQVLREPGRAARTKSYMWLYMTGSGARAPVVLFEYQETRSGAHPRRFLEGFEGCLHTDGYSAYHTLPGKIVVVGCLAHARRKFDEAVKSLPEEQRGNAEAKKGLELCNRLFAFENEYGERKLNAEERRVERMEKSKPVMDALFAWAAGLSVIPKSSLGKAVAYLLEQKPYIEHVFQDGRLELSNNRAERHIRPFVMGRKNWLFCASPRGARSSSIVYSIVETAKENGLDPYEYMKYVLEKMPDLPESEYAELLPWNESLPLERKPREDAALCEPSAEAGEEPGAVGDAAKTGTLI